MKLILSLILLLTSLSCYGGDKDYYFGVSRTFTVLSYDIDPAIDDALDDSGYRLHYEILSAVGYPIVVDSNFKDRGNKYYIGKRLNKTWDIELSYEHLGKYSANAALNVDGKITVEDVEVNANIYAKGIAKMDISALSLSFIGKMPVYKNKIFIYNRLGVAYMKTRVSTYVDYGYSYDYNYDDDPDYRGGVGMSVKKSESQVFAGAVPHMGIGIRYDVFDNIAIRLEHARYGDVINDTYFGSSGLEVMYLF